MLCLNPLLLVGLVAVLIPPLVHLLARRRADEVEWGAMQFLRLSPKSRRKLLLEQWLLMAVRMGVLGLVAVALAGPAVRTTLLARDTDQPPRDTVLLIDCSGSMAARQAGVSAIDAARRWAAEFLAEARPGDRVAVFAVKGDAVPVVGALTGDVAQAAAALELLPEPRGTADWSAAGETATRLLAEATGETEVVVLTDGQRLGWADAEALGRWELLVRKLAAEGRAIPPVWVVNVVPDRPPHPPHPTLRPITANRVLATPGVTVKFESGLVYATGAPLPRVRLEVDGRPAGEVTPPPVADPDADRTFTFARRFPPGSHLLTLRLDPPAPPGDLQHFAIDVLPTIPVLIVDGEARPGSRSLGSDFLRDALAPARDPHPAFSVRTIVAAQFTPALLGQDLKGPATKPRVVVLSNVASLTAEQSGAIERFLADGGGVLVALGDRADAVEWNRVTHRGGRGWLPVRLVEVAGSNDDPTAGPKPLTARFDHPAVRLFRAELPGGLHTAYFPRHWKLEPNPASSHSDVLGTLTNGDPFLVGTTVGNGRVIVSSVPLDNGWRTNLTGLPDFVRLAHELAYYLAAGTDAATNLAPGMPIVFRARDDEPPGAVTVVPPIGGPQVVPVRAWPAVFEPTHDPGPYRLTTGAGKVHYFAVRFDPRESDLTLADDADRAKVARLLGSVEYVANAEELRDRRGRGPVTWEVAGLLLVAVLVLLGIELWYTRRLAARQL